MAWGQETDGAAVISAIEYAKERLAEFFASCPVDELATAEEIYRELYERDNNATALGLAEYLRFMIQQREATV